MPTTNVVSGPATREVLSWQQRTAVVAPVVLILVMYPVFQLADALMGDVAGGYGGWYVGLVIYWAVWGVLFARWILGRDGLRQMIRPQRPSRTALTHVAFLVAAAAAVRLFVPGMAYELASVGMFALLASSALGNGVLEEVLWRGVYLHFFPHSRWLRVMWPSVWFGLWHLVPGSVVGGGPNAAMVIGPLFMGLYLAYVARKTGSVWWPSVAHVLGGLVMIS